MNILKTYFINPCLFVAVFKYPLLTTQVNRVYCSHKYKYIWWRYLKGSDRVWSNFPGICSEGSSKSADNLIAANVAWFHLCIWANSAVGDVTTSYITFLNSRYIIGIWFRKRNSWCVDTHVWFQTFVLNNAQACMQLTTQNNHILWDGNRLCCKK
jgi:hypothetical protein